MGWLKNGRQRYSDGRQRASPAAYFLTNRTAKPLNCAASRRHYQCFTLARISFPPRRTPHAHP
ncbi:hypothetical protein OH686_17990 [Pseudomonas sp. SO81]|nr:hypothetical protein OH686_17990 [Pseudomonas sp. SO81]